MRVNELAMIDDEVVNLECRHGSFRGLVAGHEIPVYRKVRPSKPTRAASCFDTGTVGFEESFVSCYLTLLCL